MRSALFKGTAGSLALVVIAAGLGFINSILISRLIGVDAFGVYAVSMAGIGILGSLAGLGLPRLIIKETAVYVQDGDVGSIRALVFISQRWVVAAALVLAVGAFGLVCFVVELPSCTFLFIAAMSVPFLALNALRSSFLRGLGFVVLSNVPEQLVLPVMVVLLIGLTYPLSSIDGESWALSLQLAGTFCAFVIGFVLLARRLPRASAIAPDPEQGQLFRAAMPFLGLVALQLLNNQATVVLLGALGDASDAGLYHVAVRATEFIAFGLLAVNMALQPRMAAAWAARDQARAQALATESARLSSMVAIAVSLVVIGFAPTILGLFGPEFLAARDSLWLLAVGQLINVFAGSCGVTLSMAGYQRSVTRAFAVVATISVLLNVLLIPMLGHLGAATARVVSLVVWNAILVIEAYRKMGVYTPVIGWRALRRNA